MFVEPKGDVSIRKPLFAPFPHFSYPLLFVIVLDKELSVFFVSVGYGAEVFLALAFEVECEGGAFGDDLALHLRHRAHDGEKELACCCLGIDLLGDGEETGVGGFENVLDEVEEVAGRASETIQLPDDEGFAFFAA